MKNTAFKILFPANHILVILYMSWKVREAPYCLEGSIPLFLSTLMLTDITYISSRNVKENRVISLFCSLLALESWYLLLSVREGPPENFIFIILSPIIWYVSVKFILMFLFQGSGYKLKKTTDRIFLLACAATLTGICISERVFAILYGIQFLTYSLCLLIILICHWKRVAFVIKSERKCILISVFVTAICFSVYYFATIDLKNHISNFGIYLPVLLFFMSIHGIALKQHGSYPLSTVFNRTQAILITCLSLLSLGLIIFLTGSGPEELYIAVNALFAFIYLCNIILGSGLKHNTCKIVRESKYNEALRQLRREELLKTEFANFLHDEVLQDLLSVKNMMTKAHRADIHAMITETLDHMNTLIRGQMQDYHPVILKNLTVRENLQNLAEAVSQSFPHRNITVSLECPDDLFFVEPYQIFIYRLLKELLTNAFKHSDGSRVRVKLTQEGSLIELSVSDDGTAAAACLLSADRTKHKGIASIAEQIDGLEGSMSISDNTPHGVCIRISIPMKGDVSYQYFVS